jgi:hypothetical protein
VLSTYSSLSNKEIVIEVRDNINFIEKKLLCVEDFSDLILPQNSVLNDLELPPMYENYNISYRSLLEHRDTKSVMIITIDSNNSAFVDIMQSSGALFRNLVDLNVIILFYMENDYNTDNFIVVLQSEFIKIYRNKINQNYFIIQDHVYNFFDHCLYLKENCDLNITLDHKIFLFVSQHITYEEILIVLEKFDEQGARVTLITVCSSSELISKK